MAFRFPKEEILTSETLAGLDAAADQKALEEARSRYGSRVGPDDLWHYIYGTFHAPDWRERFREELETSVPRFPWTAPRYFETFRRAGAELMSLHADWNEAPQHPDPVVQLEGGGTLLIPASGMSWAKNEDGSQNLTRIQINPAAALAGIPLTAHDYRVAGHSPLQWAVMQSEAGEEPGEDPNIGYARPQELIEELRRLTYVGVRTSEIIGGLPPSLTEYEER